MIKNFSKAQFIRDYNSAPPLHSACISIGNSTDTEEDSFKLSNVWCVTQKLIFDDIDNHVHDFILFNKTHAIQIIDSMLTPNLLVNDDFQHIIVHCTAGVSRSAGVVLFLLQLRERTIITNLNQNSLSGYNRRVYNTLVETYNDLATERSLPLYYEIIR